MANKEQYIKEVRDIILTDLDNHYVSLINDNITVKDISVIDHTLLVWLNGICFAWNYFHDFEVEISKTDILPDFIRIYNYSVIFDLSCENYKSFLEYQRKRTGFTPN